MGIGAPACRAAVEAEFVDRACRRRSPQCERKRDGRGELHIFGDGLPAFEPLELPERLSNRFPSHTHMLALTENFEAANPRCCSC